MRPKPPTLYLICESPNDKGNMPNVSRLANQLEKLLKTALAERRKDDCIVVLHDMDLTKRPHGRDDYEKIQRICKGYSESVIHLIAVQTIEAWLLADDGIRTWLDAGKRKGKTDALADPKTELTRLLDKKHRLKYGERNLPKILDHLTGNAHEGCESFSAALSRLQEAPCTNA